MRLVADTARLLSNIDIVLGVCQACLLQVLPLLVIGLDGLEQTCAGQGSAYPYIFLLYGIKVAQMLLDSAPALQQHASKGCSTCGLCSTPCLMKFSGEQFYLSLRPNESINKPVAKHRIELLTLPLVAGALSYAEAMGINPFVDI